MGYSEITFSSPLRLFKVIHTSLSFLYLYTMSIFLVRTATRPGHTTRLTAKTLMFLSLMIPFASALFDCKNCDKKCGRRKTCDNCSRKIGDCCRKEMGMDGSYRYQCKQKNGRVRCKYQTKGTDKVRRTIIQDRTSALDREMKSLRSTTAGLRFKHNGRRKKADRRRLTERQI